MNGPEDGAVLYHATDRSRLDSILAEGVRAGSYWTADPRIAAYYAETVEDEEGGVAAILSVRLDALDASRIEPDRPGIDEPISTVLAKHESDVHAEWSACAGTWRDSLRIVRSVRYGAAIPAPLVSLVEDLPPPAKDAP